MDLAELEELRARYRVERYDLYRDALFGTRVTTMTWDDGRWDVRTDRGDRTRARYVVNAGGVLTHPKLPDIPGVGDFRGHTFHTSRWDYDYTGGDATGGMDRLAEKRVALVGTGVTAIQVVPHLARDAGHLYVVQRTPSTVDTRDDRATDPAWWDALPRGWQHHRRENFLALLDGRDTGGEDLVADRWTDTAPVRGIHRLRTTAGTEEAALALELADAEKMAELRARVDQVVDDPATAEALKPWYRQMCKRPTFSDRYLQAFNRENVTLLDTAGRGVERITADGLVVGGAEHRVDAIVFATGFDLGADPAVRAGAEIRGRDGVVLTDYWAGGLRTFHGWVSAGFPNLIHLGASQNAASPNFAHILEEQATHSASVVAEAERRGDVLVEPTAEAQERWVATIRERAVATHAFLAECTPGYYNGEGRPRKVSEQFGGGPVEFHALMRSWRESGGVDEVLVPR